MPKISLFKNVESVTEPTDYEFIDYLEKTRDGEWQDIVMACRLIKDHDERMLFKQKMPTATLSGIFTRRNDVGIAVHSGYINMDIDDVEDIKVLKRKLEKDKHVASVFMSTSGTGLRVIFKIDPSRHKDAFRGIRNYIFEEYGHPCDPNGISPSKPYCVSHDPGLYINPFLEDVPIWKKYVKEKPIKRITNFVHTNSDLEQVVKQIVARGVNICETYEDWLKVGFALSEALGADGIDYFHDISRMSSKYNPRVCEKQFKYCLKARGTERANIASFYYLAKINGVSIQTDNTKVIVRTTINGKKAGLSKEQIVKNIEKFSGIANSEELVNRVFDSPDDDIFEDDDNSMLPQLELFISNNYNLRMNEVNGYLENNGKRLSPSDLNTMFISAKKLIQKLDYQLMLRLLKSDFVPTYNPFYEFFGSDGVPYELPALPERDNNSKFESPLIDKLAMSIENDDLEYTTFFLRKWLVSIISAMHKVHSPLLLCLLGPQGTGKTEYLRRLLPKELDQYYAESKLDKDKDDEILMTENIIIMDDELGGKSKQDEKKLKDITSKQHFSLRRPYGDHNEKILRLAVLCGTSNYFEVVTDRTGNRRIIPIEVKNINRLLYNSVDKKELFMECFRLYKDGFDWRIIDEDDKKYLNTDSYKYETIIKEKELVEKYFKPSEESLWMTTSEVLVEIEELTRQKLSLRSLGVELERLGFQRKSKREGNYSTSKKWGVEKINRPNSNPEERIPF